MNPSKVSDLHSAPADSGTGSFRDDLAAGATDTKEQIKETARSTAAQLKSTATQTATQLKDQAAQMAGQQKETVANRIGSYSSAIRDSARSMESEDPNIAYFTQRAADRLEGIADYVRNRDLTQLRADAESLARRHPVAFLGGLFVAGLVVGNVLKAGGRTALAGATAGASEPSSPLAESTDYTAMTDEPASPPAPYGATADI